MTDWTADANEALTISLIRSADEGQLPDQCFHPTFTYPIFGDDEKIYGYHDLSIDLRFASGSLAKYLSVTWSEKLGSTSVVDNVESTLYQFIPPDYFKNEESFMKQVAEDEFKFKPFGEKIYTYKRDQGDNKGKGKAVVPSDALNEHDENVVVYEVYHATWDTPGFREYHRRMQLFILLFIEAGSFIQEDEEGWEFMVLYEKRKRPNGDGASSYHFIGYSTLFPFYCFPERVRMRLSQFVIVPPYQRQGHGSELYKSIYNYVLGQKRIGELTVEDPAEAFEDLRDRNDLRMILQKDEFMNEALGGGASSRMIDLRAKGKLGPPAEKGWLEKWRRDLKIAGRQFHRVSEMLIFKFIDIRDARAMRAFRLQVKERLYRFNFEVLGQLEREERLQKLEETFQAVKEDYQRILAMI